MFEKILDLIFENRLLFFTADLSLRDKTLLARGVTSFELDFMRLRLTSILAVRLDFKLDYAFIQLLH